MKTIAHYFLSILACMLGSLYGYGQNSHLLIFRHSGSIESIELAKLTSIDISPIDMNGDSHEMPVTQIFRMGDDSMTIPIAEIDSVVFGDRNRIVARNDAREILPSDLPYIKAFDGEVLTYLLESPSTIVPNSGEKIFYNGFCDTFPFGLCARVKERATTSNGIELKIEYIEPAEIFNEYLVTGDFNLAPTDLPQGTRAQLEGSFVRDAELETSNIYVKSQIKGGLAFRNFVGSPRDNFYSADIYLTNEIDMEFDLTSDDSGRVELESTPHTVMRGTIGNVVYPQIDLSLFCDIEAMLRLGLGLKRTSSIHYKWTRKGNDNTFILVDDNGANQDNGNTATIDFLLDGTVHLGGKLNLSFNTLFDMAGAGIKTKIGPEIKGEFGVGLLADLEKEYNPEYFGKAKIKTSLLLSAEAYVYHLERIIMGERVETPLPFKTEARFLQREFNILPELRTRAVRTNGSSDPLSPSSGERLIDAASITDDSILRELNIGYQIADKATGEILEEASCDDPVMAQSSDPQGFNVRIPYKGDIDKIIVRPVIKYADKLLPCQSVEPQEGAMLNNIFYCGTSPTCYGVAGAPIIGDVSRTEITYIIGNTLPIASSSNKFREVFKKKRSFKTISFIEEDGKPSDGMPGVTIFGSWEGEYEGRLINLSLNEPSSLSYYNGEVCNATYNTPQAGIVTLDFKDDRKLVIRIEELTPTNMLVSFGNSNIKATLNRTK